MPSIIRGLKIAKRTPPFSKYNIILWLAIFRGISLAINGNIAKINFEGRGKLKVIESQYYPEFGCSIDNKHLIYDYNGKLPSKATIRISW